MIMAMNLIDAARKIPIVIIPYRELKQRLYWFRSRRILNPMTEMEQFRNYVSRTKPQEFLYYQNLSSKKRLEFYSVINELGLNLKGTRFLDIGPGYGDALDICYENGAKSIEFVDIDPFFLTYNRLKKFVKGYQINHLKWLSRLRPMKYDIIWVMGSVVADRYEPKAEHPSLSHWLIQIEQLASPTCQIIICPFCLYDGKRRKIEDIQHSFFSEAMLNKGYAVLPKIKNHNREPQFPITFYKNVS